MNEHILQRKKAHIYWRTQRKRNSFLKPHMNCFKCEKREPHGCVWMNREPTVIALSSKSRMSLSMCKHVFLLFIFLFFFLLFRKTECFGIEMSIAELKWTHYYIGMRHLMLVLNNFYEVERCKSELKGPNKMKNYLK